MTQKEFCIMTKMYQEKKSGTKTVWQTTKTETKAITETQYNNIVNAAPFFRHLGGSETLQKTYTCRGYKVYQMFSTSPDKKSRNVRTFDYQTIMKGI